MLNVTVSAFATRVDVRPTIANNITLITILRTLGNEDISKLLLFSRSHRIRFSVLIVSALVGEQLSGLAQNHSNQLATTCRERRRRRLAVGPTGLRAHRQQSDRYNQAE